LLTQADFANVFISYKRSESSAFALLLRDRLKAAGLEPFVDMQLRPGSDWQQELKATVEKTDYFIVLIGKNTLDSQVTIQEIQWAIACNVTIIPIWHNGFHYVSEQYSHIPEQVDQVLAHTHTIRVIEENPLIYDTALRELLNRFGISI